MSVSNRPNWDKLICLAEEALATGNSARDDDDLAWIRAKLRGIQLLAKTTAKTAGDGTVHQILTMAEAASLALDRGEISRVRECLMGIHSARL